MCAADIIEQAYTDLVEWCRRENFAGYDPFDALNSRLFQATPLRNWRLPRLVWTQLVKRSVINLRPLALVPRETNAKGVALFALAALANYRRLKTAEAESEVRQFLDDLLARRLTGWGGAAWGYNFDWQSRIFFAPSSTPTIVPTAFAARALVEASQALAEPAYLEVANSTCDFILQHLNPGGRAGNEVCFAYTPNSRTGIFNASLLAAETLASVGALSGRPELCEWAKRAVRYVVQRQREDGSWGYGVENSQSWSDSFHTAFVLNSLARIIQYCWPNQRGQFTVALRRGYVFWRRWFFLADGWPKYYDDQLYPADTHAAASAIVTLCDLRVWEPNAIALAERIALWTIRHLRDPRGFFYYQKRRFYIVRTPFMRWSAAWMAYALARLQEERMSNSIQNPER